LLALAALRARRFSLWTCLCALFGGVICLVVGSVNLGLDDQSTLDIPFLIGSLLITAWILAAGYEMLRSAQHGRVDETLLSPTG
jgi:hypothetical protein